MCDYQHFSGTMKPWLHKPPKDLSEKTKLSNGAHLWWYFLKVVDTELGMGLDFTTWKTGQRPCKFCGALTYLFLRDRD
jgi:hypothetical protein